MANFTGEVPTIPSTTDATTRVSYHADSFSIPLRTKAAVRIIASGIIVPAKQGAASTGRSGGAFASNALDYFMRGFHVQLNENVTWRAPFNDVNATQYFGNGGTPGTINNVVVLARK